LSAARSKTQGSLASSATLGWFIEFLGHIANCAFESQNTRYSWPMFELVFEVTQEVDGGFVAQCLTESIVTEGDTWEQLRRNLREAVAGYCFDSPGRTPKLIGIRA
jgi:hypothetical protein